MSAESAVLAGRVAIEAIMVDACTITRDRIPTDAGYVVPTFNNTTGQYSTNARVMVYTGKCRVQVRADINSNAVEAVVGEHEFTYRTGTLQLPIAGTGNILPNYIATLTACPLDPEMVGRVFNLGAETKGKTHATHRRYRIKETLA